MSGVFLDTNILVYSVDHRDPAKQSQAVDFVTACIRDGSGVISTQVLQEFAAVSVGKLHQDSDIVSRQLLVLESLKIIQVTPSLIRRALELFGQYQMNFWDATILAAAEHASCDRALVRGFFDRCHLRFRANREPVRQALVVHFTNNVRDRFVGWDQRACEARPTNTGDWWAGTRKLAGPTLQPKPRNPDIISETDHLDSEDSAPPFHPPHLPL